MNRPWLGRACGVLAALAVAFGSRAADAAEIPYVPILEVRDGGDALAGTLREVSPLHRLRERPPTSMVALERRIADDKARLTEALNALSYWAPTIGTTLEREAAPARVVVKVDPGPAYLVQDLAIVAAPNAPALPPGLGAADGFGLALGATAASAEIVAAERRIATRFGELARPLARMTDRTVIIDHAMRSARVTWTFDPGPPADFGETAIDGLSDVDAAVVRRRIKWRAGQPYDARKLEATRKALVESSLFASVRIAPGEQVGADGRVPVTITVVEGKRRSIGGGARYSTSAGFGVEGFWEHRDLFGSAERFRVSATFAEQELGLNSTLRRPYFLHDDQTLLLSAAIADETPVAYDNRYFRLYGGIERKLSPRWNVGGGLQYDLQEVDAHGESGTFHLVSLPLFARYDSSNDLLNPVRGLRTSLSVIPYTGVQDTALGFLKLRIDQTGYWPLDDEARFVLAGTASFGTILGAGRNGIPAPQRFYAGGGGSVRGFGYQMAGPVDVDEDPLGGKSLLTVGTELRVKITDTIGVVPFLEAGTVFDSTLPSFDERIFVGAGIGLRYYTDFGPVRLDIATPLNRRRGIDDLIQVYISLGQAF